MYLVLLTLAIILFIIALKICCKKQICTKVIYSSQNFLIVDKQPDFKINSNNKSEQTVQTFLKKKYPKLANKDLYHEFYFPHRLDFATSGILCIPKSKESCKSVSDAFSNRATKKYYIALVRGLVSQELVDVNIAIGEDSRHTEMQKMCTTADESFCNIPRIARTIFTSIELGFFQGYPATKVLCRPITGRRHQIRVHCSYLGHTIIGDYTYSNKKDVNPPRMFLHSFRLALPNSNGIENIDISTEDPFKSFKGWKVFKTIQDIQAGYNRIETYYLEQ